jgi:hypothetical protein
LLARVSEELRELLIRLRRHVFFFCHTSRKKAMISGA